MEKRAFQEAAVLEAKCYRVSALFPAEEHIVCARSRPCSLPTGGKRIISLLWFLKDSAYLLVQDD